MPLDNAAAKAALAQAHVAYDQARSQYRQALYQQVLQVKSALANLTAYRGTGRGHCRSHQVCAEEPARYAGAVSRRPGNHQHSSTVPKQSRDRAGQRGSGRCRPRECAVGFVACRRHAAGAVQHRLPAAEPASVAMVLALLSRFDDDTQVHCAVGAGSDAGLGRVGAVAGAQFARRAGAAAESSRSTAGSRHHGYRTDSNRSAFASRGVLDARRSTIQLHLFRHGSGHSLDGHVTAASYLSASQGASGACASHNQGKAPSYGSAGGIGAANRFGSLPGAQQNAGAANNFGFLGVSGSGSSSSLGTQGAGSANSFGAPSTGASFSSAQQQRLCSNCVCD